MSIRADISRKGQLSAPIRAGAPVFYYLFLSDLLGAPVRREGKPRPIGRLVDIGMHRTANYPEAVCVRVRGSDGSVIIIPWSSVTWISTSEVRCRQQDAPAPTPDFWLRHDLMGSRVVDVLGGKVVRVNDVHLLYAEEKLIGGHVDIGALGVLRRLRLAKAVQAISRWVLDRQMRDRFVSCQHIEIVPGQAAVPPPIPDRLLSMNPPEMASILGALGRRQRQVIFRQLPLPQAIAVVKSASAPLRRILLSADPARADEIRRSLDK